MENNKTQAEIYREERKERLAKAAAKQAKKSPKLSKTKSTTVRDALITARDERNSLLWRC